MQCAVRGGQSSCNKAGNTEVKTNYSATSNAAGVDDTQARNNVEAGQN